MLPRAHGSALFTRGETQALVRRHARHRRRTSRSSTRSRASTASTSCCTTTSRPIRWARPAAWVRRAAARSATASSPGARSIRCCRRRRSSPTRCASSRRSPKSTARRRWRRCAARSLALMDAGVPLKRPVAGIAMGLIKEDQRLRRAVRHPRRRGPSRRHGLQGGRHRKRRHRAADGHQDHLDHARRSCASRWRRRATGGCTSWARWRRR